jgi:hypothetical protein
MHLFCVQVKLFFGLSSKYFFALRYFGFYLASRRFVLNPSKLYSGRRFPQVVGAGLPSMEFILSKAEGLRAGASALFGLPLQYTT